MLLVRLVGFQKLGHHFVGTGILDKTGVELNFVTHS